MAKLNRNDKSKSQKPRPTARKANAAGYAKRHSRKAKALAGLSNADVYEYEPQKVKRSRDKVALELGRDEVAELGLGGRADDNDDAEVGEVGLRARLIGEGGEDERIGSDDDEEIESDDAFEESDEERFAGFSFSENKKNRPQEKKKPGKTSQVRFAEVDLNEDDDEEPSEQGGTEEDEDMDEEEEGDSDEFIDVLDVLDGKGEADNGSDSGDKDSLRHRQLLRTGGGSEGEGDEDDDSDGSDVEEDEDEEQAISASDVEESAPSALQDLENFISTLDPGKKRKADDGDALQAGEVPRTRKRRMIKERTEAGAESAFGAQASSSSKLKLDDLLAPLTSQSSNLLSLKKTAKTLASTSGSKTLSAPLPQRTQERLDREAAYEQTKEEVDKWKDTMKRIKEAEHLSFPLQAKPAGKVSNLELTAKFKPTTELESSIDKLLKSAKMRDEDIQKTEELKMNHLSVEEVATRRAELRKMRELMFRADLKAKRVAKIKSKAYRRIKKKERAKLAAQVDGEEDDDDEEARMKREVERARERATLRHKNTGKWAKAMKAKGELDVDERREISEMLQRGEQLRRKIRGERGSDDEDHSEDDSDAEEDLDRIKAGAFEELSRIQDADETPTDDGKSKDKSLFEMKFMKDAMAREQHQVDRMKDDFIKEMGGIQNADSDEEVDGAQDGPGSVAVERTGGRIAYRPGSNPAHLQARPIASLPSDASSVTLKSTDFPLLSPPPDTQPTSISRSVAASSTAESNPWLVLQDDAIAKAPRKKNEILIGKDSGDIEKSKNKVRKQRKKQEDEKERARDDAVVEISIDDVMTFNVPSGSGATSQQGTPRTASKTAATDDPDSNSEVEEQEKALDAKGKGKVKGIKAFEQRDLVARAFAGDNVVQSFEEVKRQEIAADAPREVDTTLPGWGSWGGAGTARKPPKQHLIKKVAGIDPTSRADHNKSHVIISEKRDKKAAKYMVKDLPYPYTSKAQFERSMEMPLGTEWNTRVGFQRGTLPKVVKKIGTIIDPLEKMF